MRGRGVIRGLLTLLFVVLAGLCAPSALATKAESDPPDTQVRYYAEQLRESPVYVSDQIPRAIPRSASAAFVKQLERAKVPAYLLVLPHHVVNPDGDLPKAVAAELGRDGLYLVLATAREDGDPDELRTASRGVDLPVAKSVRSAQDWLPGDATPLDLVTRFVDGLLNDGDATLGEEAPDALHDLKEERRQDSIRTGVATVVVPALMLLVGAALLPLRRWDGALLFLVSVAVGVVLVVVVPVTANALAVDKRTDYAFDSTSQDTTHRIERVATELRDVPVYFDAEADLALSAAQRRALTDRYRKLDVPVHVVLMGTDPADESAGNGRTFLANLQKRSERDGLYILAGEKEHGEPGVEVANFGARLDHAPLQRLAAEAPSENPTGAKGQSVRAQQAAHLHEQLMRLAELIDDAPTASVEPTRAVADIPDLGSRVVLPPLISDSYWDAVFNTFWITLGALLVLSLPYFYFTPFHVAPPVPRPLTDSSVRFGYQRTRRRPTARWLRLRVRLELGVLQQSLFQFKGADEARVRAWDCLDLATLLLDQRAEQRITADARICDLTTALTLIRLGQTVLETSGQRTHRFTDQLCLLNPLHEVATHHLTLDAVPVVRADSAKGRTDAADDSAAVDERAATKSSICGMCSWTLTRISDDRSVRSKFAEKRTVRLRRPGVWPRAKRVPYHRYPGPLSRCADSGTADVATLVRLVREQLGVHV